MNDGRHPTESAKGPANTVLNSPGLIIPGSGHLDNITTAISLIKKKHVGKRPPDINADNDSCSPGTHHPIRDLLPALTGVCCHITEPEILLLAFLPSFVRHPKATATRGFEANPLVFLQLNSDDLGHQLR